MLHWLIDNAILFYVLLGLVALAFAAVWWLRRDRRLLIGLAVAVVLIALVWLLTLLVVTDSQQLERAVREMAAAVSEDRPADLVKHLSRKFSYGPVTKDNAADFISRNVQAYGVTYVHIGRFDVKRVSRAEGKAEVVFLMRVDLSSTGVPFECHADFVLEDGQWRLLSFKLEETLRKTGEFKIPLR
jgi:hypothetical protein